MLRGSLLLLALLAATGASASCPRGFRTPTAAEKKDAVLVGHDLFVESASKKVCSKFPVQITEGGVKAWGVEITPTCFDGKSKWVMEYRTRNPCAGNRWTSGSFWADTLGPKNYPLATTTWASEVTKEWKNMRPLDCPAGFKKATAAELAEVAQGYMRDYVVNNLPTSKQYCSEYGFTSLTMHPSSACLDTKAGDIMVEGTVRYSCYGGSGKTRTVGLTASGEYLIVERYVSSKWSK